MAQRILLTMMMAILLGAALPVQAQENKPVMVIRFNQDVVGYERPLEKVVRQAMAIKPDVFFEVVAIIPDSGQSRENKKKQKQSEQLASQVVESMQIAGLPRENIRVTYQSDANASSNEMHVFVR